MRFRLQHIPLQYGRRPKYGEAASAIIKRIEGGEQVGTSILAISQVCGYLRWRGRPHSSPRVLYRARIDWSLWNDLAITIQMKRLRVDEIHSNDTDFDRIPGVKRIFKWLKPKHA